MQYRTWLFTVALLVTLSTARPACGAVTIDNPKGLQVDASQVNFLYTITCQEIAEAYNVRNYKDLQVPLTLVLGEDDERYVIDHLTGAGTVYLRQWIEQNFVAATVMIAFHRVLSNDRFNSEVIKILTRFEKVKPQTVTALRRRPQTSREENYPLH